LYRVVDGGGGNIVISPYSVHSAMSMLYHGSHGETRRQLGQALGLESRNIEDILGENRDLLEYYREIKNSLDTDIELANSLFSDEDFAINEDYQLKLRDSYLTKVRTVNFTDNDESVGVINDWVKNKTEGLIEYLVESVSPDTRMMLFNAIYFKANWRRPFVTKQTKKGNFHVSTHESLSADFMNTVEIIEYGMVDQLKSEVISLPYENKDFRMLIFLPNEDSDIENLESSMFKIDISSIDEFLFPQEISLHLPKFKIGFTKSLKEPFKTLGVTDVFGNADLTDISNETLFVSDIIHKTEVEVNEEGSEAAAVTSITIGIRTISIPTDVNVNRPFIFIIQDRIHNIPLFVGKINYPTDGKTEVTIITEDNEDGESINTSIVKERLGDLEDLFTEEDTSVATIIDASGNHLDEMSNNNNSSINEDEPTIVEERQLEENEHLNDIFSDVYSLEHDESFIMDYIVFPKAGEDTEPIKNYKREFGDGSVYGVKGELAHRTRI
jgi:serpin B